MTKQPAKTKHYFICNPAGAIHEVTYTHAKYRLSQLGYRMATADEVKAYNAAGGHQVAGKPLGTPFSTEPEPVAESDEVKEKQQAS